VTVGAGELNDYATRVHASRQAAARAARELAARFALPGEPADRLATGSLDDVLDVIARLLEYVLLATAGPLPPPVTGPLWIGPADEAQHE
jgi:hypothetical protein